MNAWVKVSFVGGAVAVVLTAGAIAIGYSTGPGSCTYPSSAMGTSGEGTGGFVIAVSRDGQPVTRYTPGATYTVTLSAPTVYRGFLLQSVAGSPGLPDQNGVGTFVDSGSTYQNGPCVTASSSIGHSLERRDAPAASDTFQWIAPALGTGDVTFHAVGVYSRFDWYGQDELITTTLNEGPPVENSVSDFTTLKTRFE